jgi:ribosomal 50S subunit-associated protein YjgA (DUF615 family)
MAKKKFQWVAGEDTSDEENRDERVVRSRSARKRDAVAVQGLVHDLMARRESTWIALELEEDVIEALHEAVRLKRRGGRAGTALRRHVRYTAGLLRREGSDPEAIALQLKD